MIPDAFGWETPNSRLLCDAYASRAQCLVYLPEFQNGHHLPLSLMTDLGVMTSEKESMLKKAYALPPLFLSLVIIHHPIEARKSAD